MPDHPIKLAISTGQSVVNVCPVHTAMMESYNLPKRADTSRVEKSQHSCEDCVEALRGSGPYRARLRDRIENELPHRRNPVCTVIRVYTSLVGIGLPKSAGQ
jgi:hypothetical protein